jgi:hypothetical protein
MRLSRLITSLTPLLLLLLVSGCRSVKETTQVRTEYVNVYQRDSVWVDCTDTFFVEKSGDTVRIMEKITEKEYHYTVYRDTLRSRDTLVVEKIVKAAADTPKKRNGWKFFVFGFFTAVLIIFAARILIKIYLKK